MCLSLFFPAFLPLTLCAILFTSKIKEGGLGSVYTRKRSPTRVPCRDEFLIYYCVYTFASFLLITCPSWRRYLGLTRIKHALPTPVQQETDLILKRKVILRFMIPLRDLAPEWNRLFAGSYSRGTKPPCWWAKVALGQDKQKTYIILNCNFLCLSCPSATFAHQHGGFVPREWLPTKNLYYLRHSNRGEFAPGWQFLVVSCKRIQSHERKPGWTHPGIM